MVLVSIALLGCGSVDTDDSTTEAPVYTTDSSSEESDSTTVVATADETIRTDETATEELEEEASTEESEPALCSDGSPLVLANGELSISGTVTFDRIGVNPNGIGLDHDNVKISPARQVWVKAIGPCNEVVTSTTTNDEGEYLLTNLPENTEIKIRVYSLMQKEGTGGWDLRVQDNTNNDAIYVLEGSLVSTGTTDSRRSLHAASGWNDAVGAYTSTRAAAPFAILDSIYSAMKKVINVDAKATFPRLLINWSVNNIAAGNGSEEGLADGQIITSHYDGDEKLYILGDANSDTDEFDDHIMIHEWAHYFESTFSRSDSIGGAHTEGDILDIRVAFGEGWGNAFSAIATDNPIYFDTLGYAQSQGWSMDIESSRKVEPGWYSEGSIQRIIYDLYDEHDDDGDQLFLGFEPIYDVLTGPQKTTKAFTSIFTFMTALKEQEPADRSKIDAILASESIGSIDDIYGNEFYPLYLDLSVGKVSNVCTSTRFGIGNKLDNHRYLRFTLDDDDQYTIRMVQTNGNRSDPDFMLFKSVPFEPLAISDRSAYQVEESSYALSAGEYLLDITDYNGLSAPCFDVVVDN